MTGTERKVFQKYYPPDYDPSKLRKEKTPGGGGRRNRQFVQRVMTPFNMSCNTCHEYIYKGKKFNMKRETVEGETYLGLNLFRFYFKCPNCLAEITFKTDLENCDYQNEHGATRLFEAFKLYKEAERAKEAQEAEDAKDPMKMLEKRTMMSRAEMEAMGDIEDLQELSRNKEATDVDSFLSTGRMAPGISIAEQMKQQEQEDEEYIRQLYGKDGEDGKIHKRLKEEESEDVKPSTSRIKDEIVEKKPIDLKPSFARDPPKRGSDQKSLLSKLVIVKKKKTDPSEDKIKKEVDEESPPGSSSVGGSSSSSAASTSKGPPAGLLSLADYGSDSDDE